jgi:hypothetical protein
MRLEWRWPTVAMSALAVGAIGAQSYATALMPYYRAAAAFVAQGRPWTITGIDVARHEGLPGEFLLLHGEVRKTPGAARPRAVLTTRIQVGAVVEGPLIFWTLVLLWPAGSVRRRLAFIACGIPICLALEAATTVCQLLNGFAEASAVLAGDSDPLTGWERWSRFLESGGRDVAAVCAAMLTAQTVAFAGQRLANRRRSTSVCHL